MDQQENQISQDLAVKHRPFPQSMDAELGLLQSILLSPLKTLDLTQQRGISELHFFSPAHGLIYQVACEMRDRMISEMRAQAVYDEQEEEKPIEFLSLMQELRDLDLLEKVGGTPFVTKLFALTSTEANAASYVDLIQRTFAARELIRICAEAVERASDGDEDPFSLLAEIESKIVQIGHSHTKHAFMRQVKSGVIDSLGWMEKIYETRSHATGIGTGFVEFDRMTGGLLAGEVTVIAAEPGMGKSAVAMNIVEYVALTTKTPVAVFSLEFTFHQLCAQMLCSGASLNIKKLKDEFPDDSGFDKLTEAAQNLVSAPIYLDDRTPLTVDDFRTRARLAVKVQGVKLIVIDYFQKLKAAGHPSKTTSSRKLELSEISDSIANTARELEVSIIVLVHLDRGKKQGKGSRYGRRPQLSDLRSCGSLEQDAHSVVFMLRPHYKGNDDERSKESEEALMIVAKHRDGPTGDIKLLFQSQCSRFQSNHQEEPW